MHITALSKDRDVHKLERLIPIMDTIVAHPIEHDNQRLLTTSQIAELYGTDRKTIAKNFERNQERYVLGKHYFVLEGEEKKAFLNRHQIDDGSKNAKYFYLWTRKGALHHAKSLGTDEAWEMYERLVDEYFVLLNQVKEENPQPKIPVYFNQQTQDRCHLNSTLLSEGYWCVENEMVSQALVLQSLQKELQHWCLPSGSGGKKWIQHLREIQHPLLNEENKVALWVPNLPYPVKIMVYPYALLPYFRRWLRVEYAKYYDTKYAPPRVKDTDNKQIEP